MRSRKRRILPVLSTALLLLPVVLTACLPEEEAASELAAVEAAFDESELKSSEKRDSFAPLYAAVVDEYWGTEAALDAKLWLLAKEARGVRGEEREALVAEFSDTIFQRYAGSPHMEKLGESISYYSEEQVDQYFGRLRADSRHVAVRAAAIYHPARQKLSRIRRAEPEDTLEIRRGVEADFRLLMDEYGDVQMGSTTYGVIADAHLNAHTREELAIGERAPEIIGTTADGEEIRLSDFLGKVTVIDFWGDW